MKVCIINNLYPPHTRGGAEQVVLKTVEGLLSAGHKVVVVTTAPVGAYKETSGDLTIYRYRPANLFFYTDANKHNIFTRILWHLIDMFHLPSMCYVEEILRQEKPDVIHTHNLMGMSFLIPRMIRRLSIRHIHTVHDVQLVEPSGIIRKAQEKSWRYTGLPVRVYSAIMRYLVGSPDVVISPSQFLLNFYESRGFFPLSKRVVLRNPVTEVPIASGVYPRLPAGEAGLNPPQSASTFLYLGQIEEHKGVLFLVKTFLEFINKYPSPMRGACLPARQGRGRGQSTLHIAGTGSHLTTIKDIIGDCKNIILHGFVERQNLPQLFATTDVMIVPSLCYENSPTVIFESFSFGVPVLASNVEGIAELIVEGENGLTFETENQASLTNKLQWCVEHRDEIAEMSKKTAQSLAGLSQGEYVGRLVGLYSA